jgi:hypothetical protein
VSILSSLRLSALVADLRFDHIDPELVGIGAPARGCKGRIAAAVNPSGLVFRVKPHVRMPCGQPLAMVHRLRQLIAPTTRPLQVIAPINRNALCHNTGRGHVFGRPEPF